MITWDQPFVRNGETVICFGDSITAGDGYAAILRQRLSERKITVVNSGRGGDKTPWALTRFQCDVLDRKPAAIFIFLGTNDAAIGRGRWQDEPQVSPEAYQCNLVWMAHLAKQQNIERVCFAAPAGHEAEGLLEFGPVMERYARAARDAAAVSRCRIINLDTAFAAARAKDGRSPYELFLTVDGTHFSETGNQIAAAAILSGWNLQ